MNYTLLGQKVIQYRKLMNITQQQLADRTRLSAETIGRIEKGKTKLSLENAVLLVKGMGVSLDALIDESTPILYPSAQNDSDLLHARVLLEKAYGQIGEALVCMNEKPIRLHWLVSELPEKERHKNTNKCSCIFLNLCYNGNCEAAICHLLMLVFAWLA